MMQSGTQAQIPKGEFRKKSTAPCAAYYISAIYAGHCQRHLSYMRIFPDLFMYYEKQQSGSQNHAHQLCGSHSHCPAGRAFMDHL